MLVFPYDVTSKSDTDGRLVISKCIHERFYKTNLNINFINTQTLIADHKSIDKRKQLNN